MKVYERCYYIGIDGGATKTMVCLGNKSGDIIEVIKLGATNYHTVGIKETKSTLKEALDIITKDHKISLCEIKGICFGGAGIDSQDGVDIITNIFRELGYMNELKVYNDALIALVGANDGYNGGVVIGGTGSVALGVDEEGQLHKVGGWGHLLDDKGSGYAIGRDALSRVMEYHDGRGRDTLLWEKIKTHLEIDIPEEITDFVYCPTTKKHDIASIAPIVINLYEEDYVATGIIEEAISHLETLVSALAQNIKKDSFSLGIYGSIIVKNDKIKEKLIERIHDKYPGINVHHPYKKAYLGALEIATGKVKID